MKKIIAALAFVVVLTGSWIAYKQNVFTATCKTCDRESDENPVKETKKKEAGGMVKFFNKMRNNPETGELPVDQYYQARTDAKHYLGQGMRGALNLQWEEMGPDNQGGRSRAILIDKDNPSKMFVGGVSGGLYVSNNAGTTWTRVTGYDGFTNQAISCIAQTSNGNIYVGTGEHFGWFGSNNVTGATGFPGGGIWKSTDGGVTFTNIQSAGTTSSTSNAFSFVNDIVPDKVNPNLVWVGIKGGGTTKGLQKLDITNDSFSQGPLPANLSVANSEVQDIECGSDGSVHIAVGVPGNNGTKYYRMKSGESTFSIPANPFDAPIPPATTGSVQLIRLEIAVSPSSPNVLYYMGSFSKTCGNLIKGVWKTTDTGDSFTQIAGANNDCDDFSWNPVTQGSYALASAVHPTNPDMLVIGGLDVYRYSPALGFSKISNWNYSASSPNYVHADIHNFVFSPTNPDIMYVVSDGGVNLTSNIAATQVSWTTKNTGYVTTQFYSACAKNYTGELLGGTQDNGNWLIDFNGNTTQWGMLIKGGDGGDVAVSTINPNILFAEYVNGDVARSSNNGASFSNMLDCNIDFAPADGTGGCGGDNEPDEGSPFISQFDLWENPNDTNYLTQSKFFLGTNGRVWMTQEALNLAQTPVWFRITKNGLNGPVSAIKATPDGQTLFVGTETGSVYRISNLTQVLSYPSSGAFNPDNFGIVVDLIESLGTSRYVTDIDIDPTDNDHVVVTLGNYGATYNYVFESNNAMAAGNAPTFSSIDGNGLPKMPVYSCLIDKANPNNIVIGTELGIYSTNNGGTAWTIEDTGMPNVPVLKLFRHLLYDASSSTGVVDNVIVAASYGRGMFRTKSLQFTSTDEIPEVALSKVLSIYPNPSNDQTNAVINLGQKTDLSISIYGLDGRLLKTENYKNQAPGQKNYVIKTSDFANGTYIVNIKGNAVNESRKLIVIR